MDKAEILALVDKGGITVPQAFNLLYQQGRINAFNEIIDLHESLWASEMGWEKTEHILAKIRHYCEEQIKEKK